MHGDEWKNENEEATDKRLSEILAKIDANTATEAEIVEMYVLLGAEEPAAKDFVAETLRFARTTASSPDATAAIEAKAKAMIGTCSDPSERWEFVQSLEEFDKTLANGRRLNRKKKVLANRVRAQYGLSEEEAPYDVLVADLPRMLEAHNALLAVSQAVQADKETFALWRAFYEAEERVEIEGLRRSFAKQVAFMHEHERLKREVESLKLEKKTTKPKARPKRKRRK